MITKPNKSEAKPVSKPKASVSKPKAAAKPKPAAPKDAVYTEAQWKAKATAASLSDLIKEREHITNLKANSKPDAVHYNNLDLRMNTVYRLISEKTQLTSTLK